MEGKSCDGHEVGLSVEKAIEAMRQEAKPKKVQRWR
jgi:hypothetical protein